MRIHVRYFCSCRYSCFGTTSHDFKKKGRPKPLNELPQVFFVVCSAVGLAPLPRVLDYVLPEGDKGQQWCQGHETNEPPVGSKRIRLLLPSGVHWRCRVSSDSSDHLGVRSVHQFQEQLFSVCEVNTLPMYHHRGDIDERMWVVEGYPASHSPSEHSGRPGLQTPFLRPITAAAGALAS